MTEAVNLLSLDNFMPSGEFLEPRSQKIVRERQMASVVFSYNERKCQYLGFCRSVYSL